MRIFLIMFVFFANIINAQEVCESPEESLEDLNSITKCVINDVKKADHQSTRQISVRISAPKKRYLTKRVIADKKEARTISTINATGLSHVDHSNSLTKKVSLSANIKALTNSLSAEEVKKAKSFNDVDKIPAFKSCTEVENDEELACFNKEMINHIEKNFMYPSKAVIAKTEGKVWVRFIVNKEGEVSNIKTLGPKGGELLKEEAMRVISLLPKFTPSVKNGKRIAAKYGFPINFALDN